MYQPISSLKLPDSKIQELHELGYYYCTDVNIEDEKFKSIISPSEWNELTSVPETKTFLDKYQEDCMVGTVLTFNKQLDEALGGGMHVGFITEFCGEPGSGKTQLCFQLCVNVQLPVWCGGMAGEAVYIGTNNGFASHRLKEVAAAMVKHYASFKVEHCSETDQEFTVESIMKKINYISADNYVELIAVTKYLEQWLKNHSAIRLVIIDSISVPLKLIPAQERTYVIYIFFKDLQQLARKHHFAIVVTNDITTRINSANSAYETPSLGGSYYHRINARVELSNKSGNVFKASIVKSIFQPVSEVEFSLFA